MRQIFPIGLLLVAIAVFFFYIDPLYTGRIATAREAVASDNASIASLAAYAKKENELLAAKGQMDPQKLALVGELLPASVSNVQTILDLDNLAASSGIAISSVDVSTNQDTGGGSSSAGGIQGVPSGGPLGSVDITLSATGTYNSFMNFLGGVESSARLLDMQGLQIKASPTGVYNYSIRLRLYWLH